MRAGRAEWRRAGRNPEGGSPLVAWLQERQYATAYHWTATRNRPLEYALRTRVVLQLLAERHLLDEAHRVLRPGGALVVSTNTDRSRVEWKHYRHYSVERFRALFDGRFGEPRMVGLLPYVAGLRFLMQAPLLWRLLRGRVRVCSPAQGQVVVGVAARR